MSESDPVSVAVQQIREVQPGVRLDSLVQQLDADQLAVYEEVIAGSTYKDASEATGVGRSTIFYWLRVDPYFKAAINAWKAEQNEAANARLTRMTDKAVSNVEKALDSGDAKLSYHFLKDRGLLAKQKEGAVDPAVVRQQIIAEFVAQSAIAGGRALTTLLTEAGLSHDQQRHLLTEALAPLQLEDRR